MKRYGVVLGIAAACAIALAGCSRVDRDNPYPVKSPMHQPFAETLAKFKAHPKIAAEIDKSKNSYEGMSVGEGLVNKGMAKLDDASLLKMAKLIPDLLEKMKPASCGQLLKGNRTRRQEFFEALEAAGVDKGRSYLDLVYLAVVKAVDDPFTPQAPHPAELNDALRSLGSRFTAEQRDAIGAALQNGKRAKDEDLCWAMVALYANIAVTPSHHRRTLLRAIVASD